MREQESLSSLKKSNSPFRICLQNHPKRSKYLLKIVKTIPNKNVGDINAINYQLYYDPIIPIKIRQLDEVYNLEISILLSKTKMGKAMLVK